MLSRRQHSSSHQLYLHPPSCAPRTPLTRASPLSTPASDCGEFTRGYLPKLVTPESVEEENSRSFGDFECLWQSAACTRRSSEVGGRGACGRLWIFGSQSLFRLDFLRLFLQAACELPAAAPLLRIKSRVCADSLLLATAATRLSAWLLLQSPFPRLAKPRQLSYRGARGETREAAESLSPSPGDECSAVAHPAFRGGEGLGSRVGRSGASERRGRERRLKASAPSLQTRRRPERFFVWRVWELGLNDAAAVHLISHLASRTTASFAWKLRLRVT